MTDLPAATFDEAGFWEFCSRLHIRTKDYGEIPFDKPNGAQKYFIKKVLEAIADGRHKIVCVKARQLGISTIMLALDLYWIFNNDGIEATLIVPNETLREKFRLELDLFYETLPASHRFKRTASNRTQMVFTNKSSFLYQIVSTRTGGKLGRGTGITFLHACAALGTPVIVEDGRIKPIEDVRVGEKVLTHTGAVATVIDAVTKKNDKGPLVEITPWLGQTVRVTGEHTIPTQRGIIEAKDLAIGDFLVMPVRAITGGGHTDVLSVTTRVGNRGGAIGAGSGDTIHLNEEFGFAMGYYLAEGCPVVSDAGTPAGFTYSRHRDEKHYADRAVAAITPYISSRNTTDYLTTVETVYGTPLARWVVETFGAGEGKQIPDAVFGWGEGFCRGLLAGLLCGDGSKTQTTCQGYSAPRVTLPTTRASIAMQARDIAASLGYGWASVSYKEAGNHYGRNCKPCWRIVWAGGAARHLRALMGLPPGEKGQPHSQRYLMKDGAVWLKIRKLKNGKTDETVCDLSVDHEDHTFRTPSMAIGNTELGLWDNNEEALDSLQSSMSEKNPNRLFVFESTANGYDMFYDMWETAKDSVSQAAIFVPWWVHEDRSVDEGSDIYKTYWSNKPQPLWKNLDKQEVQLWRRAKDIYDYEPTPGQVAWMRYTLHEQFRDDINIFLQENPITEVDAFRVSGSQFFPNETLGSMLPAAKKRTYDSYYVKFGRELSDTDVIPCKPVQATLKVWTPPVAQASTGLAFYTLGADPAYGSSEWADAFAIHVHRCYSDRMELVAEFHTPNCTTTHFAWMICYLAGWYDNTIVNLELNGPGQVVLQELEQMRQMPNVAERDDRKGYQAVMRNVRQYRYMKYNGANLVRTCRHWTSTPESKWRMFSSLRDMVYRGLCDIPSPETLNEMLGIVVDKGWVGGPGRDKDDRVIATGLAHVAWVDNLRSRLMRMGLTKARSMEQEKNTANPMASYLITNLLKDRGIISRKSV